MGIKCFFVEQIGEVERPCGCGDPKCSLRKIPKIRRTDTGEEMEGYEWQFGHGALWFRDLFKVDDPISGITVKGDGNWDNDDGRHLYVYTPGGISDIDTRASNCGSPQDRLHRCWVRHGIPPNITVDKNGPTCVAGAGSFLHATWHGMLTNGELVAC